MGNDGQDDMMEIVDDEDDNEYHDTNEDDDWMVDWVLGGCEGGLYSSRSSERTKPFIVALLKSGSRGLEQIMFDV